MRRVKSLIAEFFALFHKKVLANLQKSDIIYFVV